MMKQRFFRFALLVLLPFSSMANADRSSNDSSWSLFGASKRKAKKPERALVAHQDSRAVVWRKRVASIPAKISGSVSSSPTMTTTVLTSMALRSVLRWGTPTSLLTSLWALGTMSFWTVVIRSLRVFSKEWPRKNLSVLLMIPILRRGPAWLQLDEALRGHHPVIQQVDQGLRVLHLISVTANLVQKVQDAPGIKIKNWF